VSTALQRGQLPKPARPVSPMRKRLSAAEVAIEHHPRRGLLWSALRTKAGNCAMSEKCPYGNQASLGANNSSRAPPLRQRRAKRNTTALVGSPPIACRCLRQQAILVARVPDRPCWRSFRVDKNNSAHEEARCDECAPGPSLERCGDRRSTRALGEVTTILPGGSLATHNSDCVAKWRPWLGNRAVHFLIPPDRKVVVFQNQPKLLVQV
jgi:hypothetical protein